MDRGDNPRLIERDQLVRLMKLFAETFFVNQWDPDRGGRQIEAHLQKGETIPEEHLRAWRISREEILTTIVKFVRLVIDHYFALTGEQIDKDRMMHHRFPETLWDRIATFLRRLSALPAWVDKNLSGTVFGAKQTRDFWVEVFRTGKSPTGVQIFAGPINVIEMIQEPAHRGRTQ